MTGEDRNSTRTSLLERIKCWEEREYWETFFQIYWPLIHGFSIKSGLTDDEAQDVAQDTLIEVARRVKNQEYDRKQGPFRAWLYRLTKWRVANPFHKRRTNVVSLEQALMSGGARLESCETHWDESGAIWEEDWRKALFDAAMEQLRKKMKPRHYQVFHTLVSQGWPVAKAAEVLHMNCGQVYLIKLRGMARLRMQVMRLERTQIQ